MQTAIYHLLDTYERGAMTRRELVRGLLVLAMPSGIVAQQSQTSALRGQALNHVQINVADLTRSRAFYEKLFGTTVLGQSAETQTVRLRLTSGEYISLNATAGRKIGLDHFAVAVDNFTVDPVLSSLTRAFPNSKVRPSTQVTPTGGTTDSAVFLEDPDGIGVQIVAKGNQA